MHRRVRIVRNREMVLTTEGEQFGSVANHHAGDLTAAVERDESVGLAGGRDLGVELAEKAADIEPISDIFDEQTHWAPIEEKEHLVLLGVGPAFMCATHRNSLDPETGL